MEKYLSHWSAINYYSTEYIKSVFKYELNQDRRAHFTVFSDKDRYKLEGEAVHLLTTPIPPSQKCKLNQNSQKREINQNSQKREIGETKVLAPELAFVQVAQSLEFHRLILLGILLCARPKDYNHPAITSKAKMIRVIKKFNYIDGKDTALRALQYVEDSCRSPMEAVLFMQLSLPYNLGGYGLTGAVFDHEVQLSPENAKVLGQYSVFADLYYRKVKLFVEYDGKEFHTMQSDLQRDSLRIACILRENYQVISLRTDQVKYMDQFDVVAHNIARCLGKRIRIKDKQTFMNMQIRLRALMPDILNYSRTDKKW